MQDHSSIEPWWAVLTIWVVVNAVNTIQGIGFLSRVWTGNSTVNQTLGTVIIALVVPAMVAMVALIRARASCLFWIGPAVFTLFVAMLLVVDYLWPIEFRSPARVGILAPFLVTFFGAIFLMGLPMFRIDRRLWTVTVVTTAFLLISMTMAMRNGLG